MELEQFDEFWEEANRLAKLQRLPTQDMKAWLVKKDQWVDGDIHSEGFRYVFGSRHQ